MKCRFRSIWLLAVWNFVGSCGAEDFVFFEAKVRPVLVKHCYECHSAESGKSKGGLVLDTKRGVREGGDSGAAVVAGDPEKSLLVAAIRHADSDLEMPPKGPKLAEQVIADIEQWIKAGAADPRVNVVTVERPPVDVEAGRKFWSYQKPLKRAGDIDGFVEAKLREADLTPASEAVPTVLLRRLFFDLIGLPPTPKQVAEFSMNQVETVVDELLRSKEFGVRWGRHWLDVARYEIGRAHV